MFRLPVFSAFLTTDASNVGWGCCLNSTKTAGSRFSFNEVHLPINSKELLAVYYAIKTFKTELTGHHILLRSDNMTTLADLRKLGSMCGQFRDALVSDIYALLTNIEAQLTVSFLYGCLNWEADEKSRIFTSETSEWSLGADTFQLVQKLAPDMDFDLFASHLNNKFLDFCSWHPTPGCSHVDAFTFDWN